MRPIWSRSRPAYPKRRPMVSRSRPMWLGGVLPAKKCVRLSEKGVREILRTYLYLTTYDFYCMLSLATTIHRPSRRWLQATTMRVS